MTYILNSENEADEYRKKGWCVYLRYPGGEWGYNNPYLASEFHFYNDFHHGSNVELGADAEYRCSFCGESQ